jgi:cell surface protein SprA
LVGRLFKYAFIVGLVISLLTIIFPSNATINDHLGGFADPEEDYWHNDDTIPELPFPIPSTPDNPLDQNDNSPLYGSDPIETEIVYDPDNNEYLYKRKFDGDDVDYPFSIGFEEYLDYDFEKAMTKYWRQRARTESYENRETLIPRLEIGGEMFDRIFGGNLIDFRPQGSAELIFGINYSRVDNPSLPLKMQRTTTFEFNEKIQMNVVGQIGEKMRVNVQYDTEAAFDFENTVKLEYTGHEDEILQKIEAGNVSLPLTGTLITGSQSLFGFKTEMKFGRLTVTSIFSQQKGEASTIEVEGGAQTQEFEVFADQYEANRHFFLAHYFKENYDNALRGLPVVYSGVTINRIEVWVTNRQGNFENSRNITAFADLGESNVKDIQSQYLIDQMSGNTQTLYPDNNSNSLGDIAENNPGVRDVNSVGSTLLGLGMLGGVDYEKIESARMLNPNEYTVNHQLGYISLNSTLSPDQVMAVAFEYTIGGEVFKVGEFSNSAISAPDALVLKLIKGTSSTPRLKRWDLMMKNIYSIGTFQLNREDFWLDVMYMNDKTGTAINYVPAGEIDSTRLLTVLNLDNLNSQNDSYPDGIFDFIDGITINAQNGRIIFPVREPFGSYMRQKITGGDPALNDIADQFVFQELYDSTQSTARQMAEKNKFYLAGRYKSTSGSEISLNAINIPQGSVSVTAGAQQLQENIDYSVDYNLGRVTILNQGILEAGTPIRISLESSSLFNIQTKTLVGTHLNYEFSRDFNIGATILNMTEKPLTQKVRIGDEPVSNTIWGVNTSYRTDVPFLTKAIDFLPFIETKEMSTVTMTGEFAHLIPGHSRAISKEGNAYIDDFEGTKTKINLKTPSAWSLSGTPSDTDMFPESSLINDLEYGYRRAKLAWYVIDPYFHRSNSPVSVEHQSSHYVREIYERELFPNKQSQTGIPTNMAALNLVYYPNEKGPYNYDVNGVDENGFLTNPRTRWGGVMRPLQTNDFEEANIEYVEFWLMDPFVEDENNQGGDLYFNLGDISEDVLKDGRKFFEHGLPTPANDHPVDTTAWGLVPLMQSLVNAFDNDPEARLAQDVGYDGLNDESEREFFADYLNALRNTFGEDSEAYQKALEDPSSDNFVYFRSSIHDDEDHDIIKRYEFFNGPEGNSPPAEFTDETYTASGQTIPNVEDVNRDHTLNESENFFQYKISIRPEDLEVGKNYITDQVERTVTMANDETSTVTWYQFKVPVYDYTKRVGMIQDFKSIRFMRMYMTNFSEKTILRFATMDLVRGEWRKYNASFLQPGEYVVDELYDTPFDVSAVNIEENANRSPVNYILPPGITREIDPMNPQMRQLNEQSMSLKVICLEDGDARAVYKNVNLDVRKYNSINMFVHAEAILDQAPVYDDEVHLFVRLGTDYRNNYYEYEIPLKITAPGNYDGDADLFSPDRYIVWPEENELNLQFEQLLTVKQQRNDEVRAGSTVVSVNRLYTLKDGENFISVMGNPNLSNVRTIMIGIRNPKKQSANDDDDALCKSIEIWLNELRLTDFDNKGGWAANARLTAKLADFGSVTLAGSTSKPGFGAINQKVSERQIEEINRYDLSANLELGKFFPEALNVRIPMYIGYSENVRNPEYNPLDPDIPFKIALNNPDISDTERDSIKHLGQNYTRRKSLNFTNVQVSKTDGPPRVYDLSNWSLSYGYSEIFQRDVNTVFNTNTIYNGSLAYNYNATPKIVEPFKNVKMLSKPAFRLIKDFNFYYLPSLLSFRTNINRQYGETQLRNIYNPGLPLPLSVRKDFTWLRQYDFNYNITKNLKIDFSATNVARIDEPEGRLYQGDPDYELKRDSIWAEFKQGGRNTNYNHRFDITYTIPINKVPLFDWVTANARYSGNYDWAAGPITADTIKLGNTLQNSSTMSLNTQFNLFTLYNKVNYFKEVNQKYRGRAQRRQQRPQLETVTWEQGNVNLREKRTKNFNHKLKTDNITIKVTTEDGSEIEGDVEVIDNNRAGFTTDSAYQNVKVVITGQREPKESLAKKIVDNTLVVIMSVRNISIGYNETNGTLLPGYMGNTQIMGMSHYKPDQEMFGQQPVVTAPTIPFILGVQDEEFGRWALDNHLVTRDTNNIQPFVQTNNRQWNIRSSLEPYRDLKIDFNLTYNTSKNDSEFFRYGYNQETGTTGWNQMNPVNRGSFSMTTITWGTAFEKIKPGNYNSQTWDNFSNNRIIVAHRLAKERQDDYNVDEFGFPEGYGKTSQDVLLTSFFAAYTNKDPNKTGLEAIPSIFAALPNWRLTYDGLGKIEKLKKLFRSVNISHVYRSTYNIGSFQSRLGNEYREGTDGFNFIRDELGDYYSYYEINGASITEQFSPLISVDMTMTNSFIAKVEVRKTRNLTLSFANNQLTEAKTDEFIIGTGYRFKDVEVTIKSGGRTNNFKSDLNVRVDLSFRNNLTMIRKLEEAVDQPTAGQRIIALQTSADYVLSNRFNLRIFYDHNLNRPIIQTTYPTSNARFGFSLRFTLAT